MGLYSAFLTSSQSGLGVAGSKTTSISFPNYCLLLACGFLHYITNMLEGGGSCFVTGVPYRGADEFHLSWALCTTG